jgi:hypothetical protein
MSAEFVTRPDFDSAMARIDSRFDRLESRFERLESRFDDLVTRLDRLESHLEVRFAAIDSRFAVTEARLEARIEAATVTSIRWTVGMAFGLYAMMFGLILFVISRELPR